MHEYYTELVLATLKKLKMAYQEGSRDIMADKHYTLRVDSWIMKDSWILQVEKLFKRTFQARWIANMNERNAYYTPLNTLEQGISMDSEDWVLLDPFATTCSTDPLTKITAYFMNGTKGWVDKRPSEVVDDIARRYLRFIISGNPSKLTHGSEINLEQLLSESPITVVKLVLQLFAPDMLITPITLDYSKEISDEHIAVLRKSGYAIDYQDKLMLSSRQEIKVKNIKGTCYFLEFDALNGGYWIVTKQHGAYETKRVAKDDIIIVEA